VTLMPTGGDASVAQHAPDRRWQARADQGFDLAPASLDGETRQATCPHGQTSVRVRQDEMHFQTTRRVMPARLHAASDAVQAQRHVEHASE
jgi:hypothetical protein